MISAAYHHKGFSFVRIMQRCPEWLPKMFEPCAARPQPGPAADATRTACSSSEGLARTYRKQLEHDPLDIHRAREIASGTDPIPVGILYRNPEVPCYEEMRQPGSCAAGEHIRAGLETELDKYTVWPEAGEAAAARGMTATERDGHANQAPRASLFHLSGAAPPRAWTPSTASTCARRCSRRTAT